MDETSKLAWLWVIEYVASLKELHPSYLHGLIDEAPELHEEDLGEGAREMVALRCLEHLVDGGETNLFSSPAKPKPKPKFTLDISRSCDDVLLSILKETSNSDYDPLEWDMQAFIAHKRTTMPKSSLERLKDELLEGVHPCTASLMKHSGLLDKDEDNDRTSTDCFQQNDRDGNTGTKNSLNMAREGSTMLPMKKNGKVVDNENQADCPKDQGDAGDGDLHLNVKRFKCDVSSAKEAAEHTLGPRFDNEFVEEPFKGMIETREKESLHAERESRVQGLEECVPSENGGEKVVATNGTVRSANADAICEDEHKQNLCLKCSKDGQFLVCKGVGCPMVVHEKCLGCSPRFDKSGNFYCPFCAYHYAISKYTEAKARAASAEEELALFVNKDRRRSLGKKQREEEEPGITHGVSHSAKFNTPSRS